ncbi:HAMP domain-containing sensor histidine kinase [Actinomycetospora sp.]|jgi:signal transduction histidine kinase|uniref:sensor histidine kinase n=1 Tax=Actinomycetospora sp. TaxID=1872135 RepID=UPI002F4215B6
MTVDDALAHDIGHELATLSCLVSAVRMDPALHPDSHRRLALIEREVERLQGLVGLRVDETVDGEVSLAALLAEVIDPLALAGPTTVVVTSADDVRLAVDVRSLWRLVTNLTTNAVRAAGARGTVRVLVRGGPVPVIEIRDDGPGFGRGPSGHRGLGLPTSRILAAQCGAVLSHVPAAGGGTIARISFEPMNPSLDREAESAVPFP